jgi:hypothetical protein
LRAGSRRIFLGAVGSSGVLPNRKGTKSYTAQGDGTGRIQAQSAGWEAGAIFGGDPLADSSQCVFSWTGIGGLNLKLSLS